MLICRLFKIVNSIQQDLLSPWKSGSRGGFYFSTGKPQKVKELQIYLREKGTLENAFHFLMIRQCKLLGHFPKQQFRICFQSSNFSISSVPLSQRTFSLCLHPNLPSPPSCRTMEETRQLSFIYKMEARILPHGAATKTKVRLKFRNMLWP